jgi:hypothetical protein
VRRIERPNLASVYGKDMHAMGLGLHGGREGERENEREREREREVLLTIKK